MAITIIKDVAVNKETAWDYPLEEIPYLLEEHDGETFTLEGGRLWEVGSKCPFWNNGVCEFNDENVCGGTADDEYECEYR